MEHHLSTPPWLDPEGRLLVAPSKQLFLNLSRAEDLDREVNLAIQLGKERASIQLRKHANRSFVEINTSASKENEVLFLRWNDQTLPSIKRKSLPPATTTPPVVRLQLRPHAERGLVTTQLHERAGRDGLDRVRHKRWEVAEISYPADLNGTLEWRARGAVEWKQLDITAQDYASTATQNVSRLLLSEINLRFQDHSIDVHLDFGAFGRYCAPAESVTTTAQAELRPAIRKQIIWFCKRSKIFFAADGRPIEGLSDQELIGTFERCPSTALLISHSRVIRQAIAASMGSR
jgi:hypothetical protein